MTAAERRPRPAATALDRPALVFHDGRIVPSDQAALPLGSIALRYGVSVFEGVRLYRGADPAGGLAPWQLDAHLDRLRNSCRLMGLDERCADEVPWILEDVVAANGIAEDCYARIAASAGNPGGIGDPAQTVLTVSVARSGRKRWLATGEGADLTVSDRRRPGTEVFPSAAKNISAYAGPRLAKAAAAAAGFDDCLLLTDAGLVSEAPTATVFLVEGGRLVTPRLADAVLPGITRAWVLATARALGLEARAEAVEPGRLAAADEVFLCGTGAEFVPTRSVDRTELAGWPACPVTTDLVNVYFEQVRGTAETTLVSWADAAELTAGRSAAAAASDAAAADAEVAGRAGGARARVPALRGTAPS